jgi:phage replication O-like protein O
MKHTRIPNYLLDEIMPQCSPNEWKIVCAIIRKTAGWGKEEDEISLSQFAKLTGIKSRPTLIKAIDAAIEHGFINRSQSRNSYAYTTGTGLETKPVQKLNQFKNYTEDGLETIPKMVQKLNTQKTKDINKEDSSPIEELMDYFLAESHCRIPNGNIQEKWLDPLVSIYMASNSSFDETKRRIKESIKTLRNKGYTVANPGSIQNTAVSMNSKSKLEVKGV